IMRRRETAEMNDSQAILSAALSVQRKLLGEENPAYVDSLRSLGWVLESKGKLSEAETVLREVLDKSRRLWGKESAQSLETLENLIKVLLKEKQFEKAEQLFSDALTSSLLKQRSSINRLVLLTDLMARQGRWEEATTDASRVLELDPANQDRAHTL